MRRWLVKAGRLGLDALVLEEAELPEPGPGEVRIRMHAAALNARDWFVLRGGHNRLLDTDVIPLADGAGTVDALGPGVDRWIVGDRVTALYLKGWISGPPVANMGMGPGSRDDDGMLAEYVVMPADQIARLPASLDMTDAAAITCAGVTAWNALYGANPIRPESKVLVLGTGGVSIFALLFARAARARVIATTSQQGKIERLRALGASDVVNYVETPEWGRAVFELTGGVDKVIETGGAGSLNQSLAAVTPGGELAVMGFKSQPGSDLDMITMMFKGASVRGVGVGSAAMYGAMVQAIDRHGIRPVIDRRFAFEDARTAYDYQDSVALFGKVVIEI